MFPAMNGDSSKTESTVALIGGGSAAVASALRLAEPRERGIDVRTLLLTRVL